MIYLIMKLKNEKIYFIFFLSFIILVIYFKAISSAELVFDDKTYIEKAPIYNSNVSVFDVIKSGFDGGQFVNHRDTMYYRPFVTLTFYLEKKLMDFSPRTLHLTNVVIYIFGIIMVYLFLLRQKLKKYSAEFITLLFALSPINVDNVVWVVSRYDLFLLLFGFLSLYLLDLGIENKKRVYYLYSLIFFLLGMFSKETFLIWFTFLPVYEYIKRKKITVWYHFSNLLIVISFFLIKNYFLKFGTLSLSVGKDLIAYIKLSIFALGTYFRILIFPVFIPKFYFVIKLYWYHYILAFLFFVLLLYMFFSLLRKRELTSPFSLFIISFAPYLFLVFTNIWPFKISPRYMMIPYFAFLWLIFILLNKFWKNIKVVVFIILFLFMFFDLQSINAYKNELDYWGYSYKFDKSSSYVIYSLAASYYKNKNPVFSEIYLRKALKYPMKKTTAYYISLLFSSINIKKAKYKDAFVWIKRLNKLEKMFYTPLYLKVEKLFRIGTLYTYKGYPEKAEKVLLIIKKLEPLNFFVFQKLFNFYCAYEQWDKALFVEKEMNHKFLMNKYFNTLRLKNMFKKMNVNQKVVFYLTRHNYKSAVKLLESIKKKTEREYFFLLEGYFRIEEMDKAKKVISEFLKNEKDYTRPKKLGFFFLKRMYRVKDALFYFRKSLELNPDQPKLKELVSYLEKLNID